MKRKIDHNDNVTIKQGDMAGTNGIVTLVASINGVKRYYVERKNKSVKWYTYFQLKGI